MDIFIVDRIEGQFAVCEKNGEEIIDIELSLLPEGVHEGSVLKIENGKYVEDKEEEERLREENFSLSEDLFS